MGNQKIVYEEFGNHTIYRAYASGWHEIIFTYATWGGIDEYIALMEQVYRQHHELQQPYFIMVDLNNFSDLPLRYSALKIRDKMWSKTAIPAGGRAVYIVKNSHSIKQLDIFLRYVKPDVERHYVHPSLRDEMVAWLIEGADEYYANGRVGT